ncbi:Smr/MutS family protein [bacterium]|nr:Smr/MutS family protein [bacterium]
MTGEPRGRFERLRRRLARLLGLVPTLDLHGYRVADAVAATERFLADAAEDGHDEVRIVYGKGRGSPGGIGALRIAIPDLVAAREGGLVRRFERQVESDGHDGSMRVWLRTDPAPVRAGGRAA